MSGATIANGSIVIPRNSATWPRASSLGAVKNKVPASDTVNAASPAALKAFSSSSLESPDSPAPEEVEARRAMRSVPPAVRPTNAAARLPAPGPWRVRSAEAPP
jgi:hypothetical protein